MTRLIGLGLFNPLVLQLALVFWKGGNILFHAAALLQKYTIYKDMKRSFTDEEAVEQATRVLLATLAIPHGADTSTILTKLLDIEGMECFLKTSPLLHSRSAHN